MKKFFSEVFPINIPFILGIALFLTVIGYESKVAHLKLELSQAKSSLIQKDLLVTTWQNSALQSINQQQVKLIANTKEAQKTITVAETKIVKVQQEYVIKESNDKAKAYEEIESMVDSHFNL